MLSTDTLITGTDVVMRDITFSRVVRAGARDSAVIVVRVPPATAPRSYYVGALVDPMNAIAETSERSNALAAGSAMQVVSRWDLTVASTHSDGGAGP